jgi:mono/diheme cytochrome c family protein
MDKRDDSYWVESALGILGTFLVLVLVVWYAHANIPEPQKLPPVLSSLDAEVLPTPETVGGAAPGIGRDLREEDLGQGAELYQMFCATCHAMPGQRTSVGFWLGSDLFDGKSERDDTPEGVRRLIEDGILEEGMAPMKGVLSDQQIASIVFWMMDQRQKTGL